MQTRTRKFNLSDISLSYWTTSGMIILIGFLISCSPSSPPVETSLLWKVSGNGLEKPSYIFGTHHLTPVSFLDSIPSVTKYFEETEQTIGELDMSKMGEMQTIIMGASMMPEGVSYEMLLTNDDLTLLDSMLVDLTGVGLAQFGLFKPAMLSNLISVSLYEKYYPSISTEENIDYYFQYEALKRNRPVKALETAEDQAHVLLNAATIERQAELLSCMINHPELLKEQMDELQDAYHAQDLNALYELSEKEMPNDPCPSTEEEKNIINKDRNEKWLEQLPAIMNDKSSFVAVGAMHLPGENGLIEGLRRLGYTVEPIR